MEAWGNSMDSLVGWVETFCVDTHRSGYQFRLMGIASLNPSYISTEADSNSMDG
jgi:hypothetical protein